MAHTAIRLGYLSASTGGGGTNFEEYADLASFPPVGEEATIYLALDTEKIYRWDGASYVQISPSEVTSVNTEVGDVVLDKADIGLDQVDNTSDLDKPISTATQDALDIINDKLDANTYYHELHVNYDYTGATSDGSPYSPFKTVQDAVNAAQLQNVGGNTAILIHLKKDITMVENITVNNAVSNLYIMPAVRNNNSSGPFKIIGSLTISGSQTNRVRVQDIEFAPTSGYALTINDTPGRHLFQNCSFVNGSIPGQAGTGVNLTSTYRNFIEFVDCTIEGTVNIDGTPIAGTTVTMYGCKLIYANVIVNSPNIAVGMYNTYGIYGVTHTAGSLAITGMWGITGFFNSTANLSATNFLSLSNVSLQKFDLTFAPLNKTGTCFYQLMTVHRGETADVLNGTRATFGPTATDAGYKMGVSGNWSPAVTNVAGALDQLAANKISTSQKGAPSGVAPLNASSKIDSTYLPSYVDDVLEFANLAAFPPTGDAGILYLALDTNKIYRWSGSVYVEVSQGITDHTLLSNIGTNSHADIDTALNLITNVNWTGDYNNGVTYTVGDGVMYNGASFRMIASIGAAGYNPVAYPANWLQVTDYVSPNDIGLGNVDNTSDLDKPISDDTQDALDLKVDLAGDTMTGQLTMQDSAILIDHTATSGFTTTTELGNNYVLLLSNNGTDSKELNQTASTSTLNRTNTASTTSDANMILSVEEGAPYLFAQTTDYANDTFSQTTMTSQNIAIDFADNASGVNSTVIFGTGAYAIQTTQSDGSYVFIEGTSTGTSATQYDGFASTPLMPTLPEHYTVKEYVDNLVSGGETGILERFEVMKEPTGFVNRTSSTTSFVDLTREFTIAPVGASYEVYVQANKFVKTTAETITLDNTSGNHYIYFDIDGNLSSTQVINSDLFQNNALIAIIYWNSDTSTHTYFAEERHGLSMDGATHSYLHTVFGARYLSGLALQGFTVNGNGNSNNQAQFTSDSGSIRDEDLLITLAAQTDIPVLYRQGQLWRKKTADSFPVIYSGTAGYTGASGRLPYNQFTGGAWQLTEVANNAFVLIHVFGTNDKETPVVAIQGIATYGNVTAARLAASTEITSLTGLPFAEFVALGSVVFESSDSYTNTPKATIRSINGGSYVDFRGTQLYTPAGEPTTHSLLSNLSSDDHLQYHTDARGDARYNLKSAGDISEGTFSIINNEPLPTNITGLSFDTGIVRSFEAQVSIKIDADADLFEEVTISGIQKGSSWDISIKSVGDVSGVQFSITNAGQMQYTSENYTGFVSGTLKFRALTTSI